MSITHISSVFGSSGLLCWLIYVWLFSFQLYPLWLCPFMLYSRPGFVHPEGSKDVMYVDIGGYGTPKAKTFDAIPATKAVEAFVLKVKGYISFSEFIIVWSRVFIIFWVHYCLVLGMYHFLSALLFGTGYVSFSEFIIVWYWVCIIFWVHYCLVLGMYHFLSSFKKNFTPLELFKI